jgi:hypothetical protein
VSGAEIGPEPPRSGWSEAAGPRLRLDLPATVHFFACNKVQHASWHLGILTVPIFLLNRVYMESARLASPGRPV